MSARAPTRSRDQQAGKRGDAQEGGSQARSDSGGQEDSGEVDEEVVYSRLMRTLSSKSLRGMSQRGGSVGEGRRDSGRYSAAASATTSLYVGATRGSLKSGSLAAAARQLAEVYSRSDASLAAAADSSSSSQAGNSPQDLVLGAEPAPLPNVPQSGTASMAWMPRPSPFEAGETMPQVHSAPPEMGSSASVAYDESSAARDSPNVHAAASSRMSGLPSDEAWLQ